jgi:hypothetical protein
MAASKTGAMERHTAVMPCLIHLRAGSRQRDSQP